MFQKEKPILIYKKNNEEKTIILNHLNKEKTLREILQIFIQWHSPDYKELIYIFNQEIKYIHFKNYKFIGLKEIETPEHALCIFENCTFIKKENPLCSTLSFIRGNFKLINPIFKGIKKININNDNIILKENKLKRSLSKKPVNFI